MQTIWAEWALSPEGWQAGQCVNIAADGRIAALWQSETCPARAEPVSTLLPALCNLHSHSFQRAMAGLAERRGSTADSFWTWRQQMYRFVEMITPEDLEAIAAQVQMEMLEAGYAAVGEFHYLHHGAGGLPYNNRAEMCERVAAAAYLSGIGLTLLPVLYQQGSCDGRPLQQEQLRFGNSLHGFQRLKEGADAAVAALGADSNCGVALHSLRAVEQRALAFYGGARGQQPLHIHVAEQTAEVEQIEAALGARPVQWLMDNCAVDERWCLIHATHMDERETNALARSGAVAGLCPITEANLGDGVFNGLQYHRAGGRFGIGSDSNVRIALAEELRLYEYSQRLLHRQRTLLAPQSGSNGRSLYEAAAVGGAQALGRDSARIAVGATADLLALRQRADALIGRSCDSALDSWIFAADDSVVDHVWSAGRHLVQNGRHIRRDQIKPRFVGAMRRMASH